MKTIPTVVTGAMLALLLGPAESVGAQARRTSPGAKLVNRLLTGGPRWAPVTTFDVVGVKLGMTPEEVRAALRSAGYASQATDPTQDAWSAVVSRRAAERIGGKVDETRVSMFTRAKGPQGENVEVWYAATQEGARATSIEYAIPTKRMERAIFAAGVIGRYGRPTVEETARGLYCLEGERNCLTYGNKALPHLLTETSYSVHSVKLMEGGQYKDELRARTAAAVEAAAPKDAKASF